MGKTKLAYLSLKNISEGCFSDEYAINVENYWGETTSGFFEKQHVKEGMLEVKVVEEKGNMVSIIVPGRFIEGNEEAGMGNFITVNRKTIIP
ncbi:hypothetical protein CL621_00340 [archaeon]|nr:hypothetical protein [archaeon]|tara:strand:- start:863 stop:1138 length:276 start_codon:yes stop_codon:yes gene_type:complete